MISGIKQIIQGVFLWIIDNPLKASISFLAILVAFTFLFIVINPSTDSSQEKDPAREFKSEEVVLQDEAYIPPLPIREKIAAEKYTEEIKNKPRQDKKAPKFHFDGSEEEIAEREAYIESQSALYDLPYRGDTIVAKYKEVLPDSRYLISILYSESRKEAKREWENYLEKHNDSGKTYFVIYKK